jgi:hypothetical protein
MQISHECEECAEGALFHNYREIVQYPNSGPCGGTYGSPVTTCPNNPNANVTMLKTEDKSKHKNNRVFSSLTEDP